MLDPLELVRQAKNRHYAYKPLAETQKILGEGYTPSILQGKDITKNPAGAAALAAQGVHGANTPQTRPDSPLNSVEPTANGQVLPGFADGGQVITKVSKVIESLLKRFGPEALPAQESTSTPDRLLELYKRYQEGPRLGLDESNEFISRLANAPEPLRFGKAIDEPVSPQERLRRIGSQLSPDNGVDPYNSLDRLTKQQEAEQILGQVPGDTQHQTFAEGGSTEHEDMSPSSLKWLADVARKLGIGSMSEDRARVATGIAKQFYGLDEHGKSVLGGDAWLSSQHGTPPRILDELTSVPGGLARLANAIAGGKIPENANITPEERASMERSIPIPKWSDEAADRVSALDSAVEKETGVGAAHSLPEHIEDAAAMLATPFPASKVAGEAPAIQRVFEYLTPVRPPSMGRYATDSAVLGGFSSTLDKLLDRMSAKAAPKDTSVDPEFEQSAMGYTNQHYAGGGKILDLTAKLAELAKKTATDVPREVTPSAVTSFPDVKAQQELRDFAADLRNRTQKKAMDQQSFIQTLGHKYQVGDIVAGQKGNYKVMGLAGTKNLPEDTERLKAAQTPEEMSALNKALRQEKVDRPWGPAYFVEGPNGDRFTMPEWGIQHNFEGPQSVPTDTPKE